MRSMKIAVLISGQPRFTREFDDFLLNLRNYSQIDFFFLLWKSTPQDSPFIPHNWPSDTDAVRSLIERNLPENSRIAELSIVDPEPFNPSRKYNLSPWTNHRNMWYMFYGIYKVNQHRENWETQHGPYNMVIRARPDAGVKNKLNLQQVQDYINQYPQTVMVPGNRRYGIGISINDMLAFGSGKNMSIYSRVFENMDQYHDQGVPFHNETLLGHHLNQHSIIYPVNNIEIVFRDYHCPPGKIDYGRWA